MIPTDEKVRAITFRIVKALEESETIKVVDQDMARRAVKKGLEESLKELRAINAMAREKIQSLSRKVEPGTRDWDELMARYVMEERRKRGV